MSKNTTIATRGQYPAKMLVPAELGLSVILVITTAVLALAVLVLVFFLGSKRVYPVAIDAAGRVIPMISLDKPYVNDSRILGFVDECIRRSFSHDYENFRMSINDAKNCYTPGGASEYEAAISPLIADVTRMNLVMSVSLETSVVVNRYIRDGIYVWETQTPMTLYRRGTRETLAPARFLVTSMVIRVPLEHDVRGIAIRAINVRPYSGR